MFANQARKNREAREARWDNQGEGTRGGKVIGRTKSGKPIYESHNHPEHAGFTAEDHADASAVHNKLWSKHVHNKAERKKGGKAEREAALTLHNTGHIKHAQASMKAGGTKMHEGKGAATTAEVDKALAKKRAQSLVPKKAK